MSGLDVVSSDWVFVNPVLDRHVWSEVTENYSQEPQGNASTTPSITNIVLQDLSFVDCKLTSLFDGLPGVCVCARAPVCFVRTGRRQHTACKPPTTYQLCNVCIFVMRASPESIMTNITLANVDFGGKVKFSPCDYVDNAVCLGDVSDCPPCFKKQ